MATATATAIGVFRFDGWGRGRGRFGLIYMEERASRRAEERGESSKEILEMVPQKRIGKERGLNR